MEIAIFRDLLIFHLMFTLFKSLTLFENVFKTKNFNSRHFKEREVLDLSVKPI